MTIVVLSDRLATADSSALTELTLIILPDGAASLGAGKQSDIAQLLCWVENSIAQNNS